MRVTQKNLEFLVAHLNNITGHAGQWNEIGAYILSGAYGGWQLQQVVNESGGVTCPIGHGFSTKRELYAKTESFIAGIEAGKENQ